MRVVHYHSQWLWLSDSFVYEPMVASRHPSVVITSDPPINLDAFPHAHVVHLPGRFARSPSGRVHPEATPSDEALIRASSVVHVHHGYSVDPGIELAALLGAPVVASFWGYDVMVLPQADPEHYRRAVGELDAVITPSAHLARLVGTLGFPPERIRVISGGVDTRFFRPSAIPEQPVVAFVGRFVQKKGIDVLVAAWSQVRRSVPDARLVLLGYGSKTPRSDASAGIQVLTADPTRPRQQVREVIASCRVYVSPSRMGTDGDSESQHVGNLESMACNRPVVTTRHGAIPEFVANGETGLVVPEGSPDRLAEAIVTMLTDYELCRSLSAEAGKRVALFDTRVVAARIDALYEELVANHRSPHAVAVADRS